MLQENNNTATRIILDKLGGTQAIADFLASHAIHEIGKDYYTMQDFARYEGITALPANDL